MAVAAGQDRLGDWVARCHCPGRCGAGCPLLPARIRRPEVVPQRPDDPGTGCKRQGAVFDGAELRRVAAICRHPPGHEGRHGCRRGPALREPFRGRPDRHRALAPGAGAARSLGPGRLDDHPAAGPERVSQQRPDLWPEGAGDIARAGHGAEIFQAADSRTLSEQGLLWRRCLWH